MSLRDLPASPDFTTAGQALTRVAPHLGTSIPSLVRAAEHTMREIAWNCAGLDALTDRSAPHGRQTYRDSALGNLDRHEEQIKALRRMLSEPDRPGAA